MSNDHTNDAVAWQSRFIGQEWASCSEAHWRWVTSCPEEFEGYEARELFQSKPSEIAPVGLLEAARAVQAAGAAQLLGSPAASSELAAAWRVLERNLE